MAEQMAFSPEPDDRLMCGSADCEATLSCLAPRSCNRTPTPPQEPSLVALDAAEAEAVRALLTWRAVDRRYAPEDPRSWEALLRLRDVADRIELRR